jgi:glycosyltransferase involved in cell wall biosynthesis
MKVCVFRASDGACDFYRTVLPIHTATIENKIQSRELWISNLLISMVHDQEKFIDAMDSDIYFLQRINKSDLIDKLKNFTNESKIKAAFVMDYDDDIFNVSPLSNHYVDYGIEEIKIENNGKIIHEWKDGVNIDIKKNQHTIDEIKKSISSVDMITTTSEHLANVFTEFNRNVVVLPNCVDLNHWNKLDIRRKNPDEIRICWAGGHSHWEDLYLIRDSLIEIARKHPNVKILMVGYMPHSMEKDFRPEQFEFHPWVETPAHPFRTAALDIDIAVIPCKDSIFNRSKSTIKWVEFSSLKIPCVTSYVQPYRSIQDYDNVERGIFVENNDENGWIRGLELLINNEELRRTISENGRKFVEDHHDINTQYHQWIKAFNEAKNVSYDSSQLANDSVYVH